MNFGVSDVQISGRREARASSLRARGRRIPFPRLFYNLRGEKMKKKLQFTNILSLLADDDNILFPWYNGV